MLDQERADEVVRFFDSTPSDDLYLTDFCLHSIGVILSQRRRSAVFHRFVLDLFGDGDSGIVRLSAPQLLNVVDAQSRFRLDFDDVYQYVAAETRDLTLVSFDSDFDRTERGRQTPAAILAQRGAGDTEAV